MIACCVGTSADIIIFNRDQIRLAGIRGAIYVSLVALIYLLRTYSFISIASQPSAIMEPQDRSSLDSHLVHARNQRDRFTGSMKVAIIGQLQHGTTTSCRTMSADICYDKPSTYRREKSCGFRQLDNSYYDEPCRDCSVDMLPLKNPRLVDSNEDRNA